MYRTHNCGELTIKNINEEVQLAGWIQTIRKFGSITFIDLRDRFGITQLLFNSNKINETIINDLGREFVIQIKGKVTERSNKNLSIPTGEIEIIVTNLLILNNSKIPPFTIQDDTDGGEDLRYKYRFLDLRRNTLKNNLLLRFEINKVVREYLISNSFIDIETPYLIRSTPEGARDFVVPSRLHNGQFYALPQSPQLFKQLLMVSGFDRYFQIVKCFRDEDLRADRQPEFTQIDCELSFIEQEDLLQLFSDLIKTVMLKVKNIKLDCNLSRLTWEEAMWNYGNDKPDLRFELNIINFKKPPYLFTHFNSFEELISEFNFPLFNNAETILALNCPNLGYYSRKQLDELTQWVKRPQIAMTGLVYIKYVSDIEIKSNIDKYLSIQQLQQILIKCQSKPGDLVLLLAGKEEQTRKAMSELRLEIATILGLRKKDQYCFAWILDFPLFEYSPEESRWIAKHHPFTSPKTSDIPTILNNSPETDAENYLKHPYYNVKANAYDLVLNGNEIGGGSIRIFERELQEKIFYALGFSPEDYKQKFGFLLTAFEYGAPPHGGIALGLDRICTLLGGGESIRDYIAFPKNNSGRDIMLDSPNNIEESQLRELNININCPH